MSSSSSSPRETYEEDREYESQAKRLKTEEGEIDYSAEEGENRREATPRGGGDGGGGGRSFSQPVTKRGPPCPLCLAAPREAGPVGGASVRGLPLALLAFSAAPTRLAKRPLFSLGLVFWALPVSRIPTANPALSWPQAPQRVHCRALNLGRVAARRRRGGVASALEGFAARRALC